MPPATEVTVTCLDGEPAPPTEPLPPVAPQDTPTVVWTHRAEHQLQTELTRCHASCATLRTRVAELDARLQAAFPHASVIIVLEVYIGFRPRRGENILLVDVRDGPDCGTAIVKLANNPATLDAERAAWDGCVPVCFPGNAVFMRLQTRAGGEPTRAVALVYQDAQPHIGTDETVWLEEAVLRAVRFGALDTHTVVDAIREVYAQLGRVLYGAARVEPLEAAAVELNPTDDPAPRARTATDPHGRRRRLNEVFAAWADETRGAGAVRVRQQVSAAFPLENPGYIDPVDYFRFLEQLLAPPAPPEGVPPVAPQRPDAVLPRRLRGPGHGDLHGRNVLVGVDDDRVGTPALFDYENMSCDNLLGWDFVKLETELKIRALDVICPRGGLLSTFARRVEQFETRLARRTVECRDAEDWPDEPNRDLPAADQPFDRLEVIVLSIREQAALHLGARRRRHREWLHEYYFLLGCYGLTTVRFENQSDRERAAALVSAGVAAVQYDVGRPGACPIGGAP